MSQGRGRGYGRAPRRGRPVGVWGQAFFGALLLVGCLSATPRSERVSPAVAEEAALELAALAVDAMSGDHNAEVTLTAFVDLSDARSRALLRWWFALAPEFGPHVRAVVVPLGDERRPRSSALALKLISQLHALGGAGFERELRRELGASEGEDELMGSSEEPRVVPFARERLFRYQELAHELGLVGAPALYVNGRGIREVKSRAALRRTVVEAGREARRRPRSYSDTVARNFTPSPFRTEVRFQGEALDAKLPVPILPTDPVWGRADAPVTLVEFSDFQCPFCRRAQTVLGELKEKYGTSQLRIVWKDNPLPFHKRARPAAEVGKLVYALGGDFWRFHDAAFAGQKDLSEERLRTWAIAAGVSAEGYDAERQDARYSKLVEQDMVAARAVGAKGTPNFRINGRAISGAQPASRFIQVIDAELAAAAELRKHDIPPEQISYRRSQENYSKGASKSRASKSRASQPVRAPDAQVWRVPVFSDDPARGPGDALVTLVVFSDFQCPFCRRVEPTLDELRRRYGRDLRIVWKDNPLPFHKRAQPIARIGRLIFEQAGNDAFWRFHDAVFAKPAWPSDDELVAWAKEAGVPAWRAERLLGAAEPNQKLEQSMALAVDLNVRGTPHFFINGRRLGGAQPIEHFTQLIDEVMGPARAAVERGVARDAVYEAVTRNGKQPEGPERREPPAVPHDAPTRGPKNAEVIVQVFSDFQCPFCARAQVVLEQLRKQHPEICVVYRHLPLPFHKQAALAAEAAVEAYAQEGNDGFLAFHDLLYAHQKELDREALIRYAQQIGLDVNRFEAALEARVHKARVEADMAAAREAKVTGTPAFFVNDYFIAGVQPLSVFERRLSLIADASRGEPAGARP